jgi:iron complex outermembrane receptor protein
MCGCACLAASRGDEQVGHDEQEARLSMHAGRTSAREHASSIRLLTGYNADPGECGDVTLGPLPEGQYTGEEAWLKLIESVCPVEERLDGSSGGADTSECKCNFGPRITRLQQVHVLVTSSSLPRLDEYIAGQVEVIGRKRIVETGAASVPDLLRYISQTSFHRGRGFRASGGQYAELRGLGAAYTLVLLNGRRAFGTAADLANSAFDLSNIPISAVERIEISMDANSLVHGMDAIGGIVNVVLNDSVEPAIEVRYGSASGGASRSHASISGGARGEHGRLAVFLDVQQWGELLGRERDRWNNQDFTRFGGEDYRSRFAAPVNVSSMDGQNLPDLGSPFAAAELNPDTGMFEFVAGQRNRTSLRAFQAIVPQGSRATISANGSFGIGAAVASLELLAVRRENELQLAPAIVPGYTWGANHPENPFGVPVRVEALLAGLPAQRHRFETDSRRRVAAIEGPLGDWEFSAFVVRSDEEAEARMRNATNPAAIASALQPNDASQALSLNSTLGRSAIPEGILVDTPVDRYRASATLLQALMQGSLLGAQTYLGIERRYESMDFDARIDGVSRNITSSFAHARVPLINPTMNVPAVKDLKLLMGARRDDYSDIGVIIKKQFGLTWRIGDSDHRHWSTYTFRASPSRPQSSIPGETRQARLN